MHQRAILVLVVAVVFAIMPVFIADFTGFRTDHFLVPQHDAPIRPAEYAFAIWILINLWLVAGMAYGLIQRTNFPRWNKMRTSLLVSLVIGVAWLQVTRISPIWATFLIWLMMLSAIMALFNAPKIDRMWARAPVSIYAGWLTVASSVSLALLLGGYGVMTPHNAAITVLFIVIIVAVTVQVSLGRAPLYGTTVVWGLLAIVVQNINAAVPNYGVASLAGIGAVIMLALGLWAMYRHTFSPDDTVL